MKNYKKSNKKQKYWTIAILVLLGFSFKLVSKSTLVNATQLYTPSEITINQNTIRNWVQSNISYTLDENNPSFSLQWSSTESDSSTSIVWGDYDGDGDLDLAVGNMYGPNHLYRNDKGQLTPDTVWVSAESDSTASIAWGDYDNDGDLDLVVGNNAPNPGSVLTSNRLYHNDGGRLISSAVWSSIELDDTESVAWGDYDGDGDLDLAVGNDGPNRLYRNDVGQLTSSAIWSSTESDDTYSIAWGDYDGDGDLDLAAGNLNDANRLYRNDAGQLTTVAVWSSIETDTTSSVMWGDYDNDGDLDLAVGNAYDPNQLYRNDAGTLTLNAVWSSTESDGTYSIVWGDYDNDGDLDLAVGNVLAPDRVHRNDTGQLTSGAVWSSIESDYTESITWGDYDNDGDLDLAAGNSSDPNRLYRNDTGQLPSSAIWTSTKSVDTTSIAWGDYDNDGDLDLAVGNAPMPRYGFDGFNRLYRNDEGQLTLSPVWLSIEEDYTNSIAWGDYDGDGDLDLAVGNTWSPNRLYRNDGGQLPSNATWSSAESDNSTSSIAWGDYDGDGDLDLAIGTWGGSPNYLYRNDGGQLVSNTEWVPAELDGASSLAWGDYDNDGDLDLVVGNFTSNYLYRNDEGRLTSKAIWSSAESDKTTSTAWGDYDSDGDLDLVVGNRSDPNRLYRNDEGQLTSEAVWSSIESDDTGSIAWGDYDNDGDLDLVTGNVSDPIRLYRNDAGQLTFNAVWSSIESNDTNSIAWGDYDGDGDLDIAVGNGTYALNRLYRNTRNTYFPPSCTPVLHVSRPLPSIDADAYSTARIWHNSTIIIPYTVFQRDNSAIQRMVGMYSLNGGGQWLPAIAANRTITSNLNTASYTSYNYSESIPMSIPDTDTLTSSLNISETALIADIEVSLNLAHTRDGDLVITLTAPFTRSVLLVNQRGGSGDNFTNTIFDDDAPTSIISGTAPFTGRYRPEQVFDRFVGYPPNGEWTLSISDLITSNTGTLLSWGITFTLNTGAVHTYTWDVYESGFMGQSDNVVFRMVAIPAIENRPNQIPGPYLYGSYASHTSPFRMRGSQVRVLSDTVPAKNAVVYRLPVSQTTNAEPYAGLAGEPFHTDGQGYLQGRGEIQRGDNLFAMLPITWTDSYTLYYTSGDPTLSGLDFYTVTALGVQTLTVSAATPLLLFDLDVSLEWDARNNDTYLTQLEHDLQRASQVLYDLSNGQVALGNVRVFHAKEHWMDAHIVIQASNKARPIANLGGIVNMPTDDIVTPSRLTNTQVITSAYIPGQVRIGATWNRFGQPGGSLEDDWPRALAHELGHYLLFLQDNYLGVSEAGLLTHTDCRGSAMTDPYLENYSEFLDAATWTGDCLSTLSEYTTGRADWETITTFYPMLHGENTNRGPSNLPLAVTNISFVEPVTPATAIPAPYFGLTDNEGHPVMADNAQAYLFKLGERVDPTDDDVLPLGAPNRDLLLARGAEPGDRICVFDDTQTPSRVGCLDSVGTVATAFVLQPVTDWSPDILVTPINSRTFEITVTQVLTDNLWVQVLPDSGPASDYLPMIKDGDKFVQTVTLPEPAFGSLIRVWIPDSEPYQEAVTRFALGEGWDGYSRGWPGYSRGWPGYSRGWPGYSRGWPAPVSSNDGQVIIFDLDNVLSPGADYALQTLTSPPDLPTWLTPVGQAYRYTTNQTQTHTSVLFKYLQRDVPEGQEYGLHVYHSTDEGQTWQRLPTELDTYRNLASAKITQNGIYALISTIELPSFTIGWNNFGYPIPETRAITQTLSPIEGKYTSVYHYNANTSKWKLYDYPVINENLGFARLVNDLDVFEFSQAYWIYATEPITLYLKPKDNYTLNRAMTYQMPPATYYGFVYPNSADSFSPTIGMTITAKVGDTICGESTLQRNKPFTLLTYKLQTTSENLTGTPNNCGKEGSLITFKVGEQVMSTTIGIISGTVILPKTQPITWNNTQAHWVNLSTGPITQIDIPIARLTANNNSPTPMGQPTTLSAKVESGNNISYYWTFGDGQSDTDNTIQHIYTQPGIYTAVVTASNSVSVLSATTIVQITGQANHNIFLPLILRQH